MNCPNRLSGTDPASIWLNRLRDYARSLELIRFPNGTVSRGVNGTKVETEGEGGGSRPGANAYKIKQVLPNFLSCTTWNEISQTEGTDFVSIAKQWLLRESIPSPRTEGGIAYAFTFVAGVDASNRFRKKTRVTDGAVETQLVAPSWCIDDVVYAESANTGVLDNDGKEIKLLMLSDSRQWTAVGVSTL
jgi:hypothetical protein